VYGYADQKEAIDATTLSEILQDKVRERAGSSIGRRAVARPSHQAPQASGSGPMEASGQPKDQSEFCGVPPAKAPKSRVS
jgi:hypothetical protein